jgi:hypothetical protein
MVDIHVKKINSKNGEKYTYSMGLDQPVKVLREKVAADLDTEPGVVKLIFKGRFLKDEMDLAMASLIDGSVVHFMCSSAKPAQKSKDTAVVGEANSGPSEDGSEIPSNRDPIMELLSNLPGGNDPEVSNEMRAMMQDPEQMRQMMQVANNPQLRLEYMRNMDRALSNIESVPGGFNALASMMQNLDSHSGDAEGQGLEGSPAVNPFSRLFPTEGSVNENPMPNPWHQNPSSRTSGLSGIPDLSSLRNMPSISGMDSSALLNSNMEQITEEMRRHFESMDEEERVQAVRSALSGMNDILRQIGGAQNQDSGRGSEQFEQMLSEFNRLTSQIQGGDLSALESLLRGSASMPSVPRRDLSEAEISEKTEQLRNMGFVDDNANRRALQMSNGDLNSAVEILLSMNSMNF